MGYLLILLVSLANTAFWIYTFRPAKSRYHGFSSYTRFFICLLSFLILPFALSVISLHLVGFETSVANEYVAIGLGIVTNASFAKLENDPDAFASLLKLK